MSRTGRLQDYFYVISGASGFIGQKLVKALAEGHAEGIGIDIRPCPDNLQDVENFTCLTGDIADIDTEALSHLPAADRKKTVFYHLAGLADAGKCTKHPELAFNLNVRLTFAALEFCRRNHFGRFVFPSTGLVYQPILNRAMCEHDPVSASSIYTATKIASEALIAAYARDYDICGISVRLSNVYGRGMNSDTVLGTMIRQIKAGENSIQVQDLTPVRDFIYVEDVIEGLIRLTESMASSGHMVVNLSTGKGSSIRTAAELIGRINSLPVNSIRATGESRPSSLILDNTVLTTITGWKPAYDLAAGLSCIFQSEKPKTI